MSGFDRQAGFAVIGCGYWGTNYVRNLDSIPGAEVVAVCDQRPERVAELRQQMPNKRVTTDLTAILRDDEVDAVIVCTEATSHYQVTLDALMAGKHVLVEKPIATSVGEAEDLVAVARGENRTLMVGHTFLFNPAIRKVKELIDGDELGRLFYLNARRTNLGPVRRDVSALWDLAPHDVSIFDYLLDSTPEWVSAVGARVLRNGREDVGFISLGYPGGVVGHIHVSWADPHKSREIVVVGSKKRVVFNDLKAPEQIWVFQNGMATMEQAIASNGHGQIQLASSGIVSPSIEASEPLKNQCLHFLDCLTKGKTPLTSGQQGLEVVRVLEAVDRSIERNGAPVDVVGAERSLLLNGMLGQEPYLAS